MNEYMTDIIEPIQIEKNEFGLITKTSLGEKQARIEDYNQMIRDSKGQELVAEMYIMSKFEYDIRYNYMIRVKKKAGEIYIQPDKEYPIRKLIKVAGFEGNHLELYL